ncbi:hypothetical protein NPIL_389071 [Nephila pilipes]|uniref:Uncharacterized protein n=1 Tax=Nephila pilipes TaxID=299642 RepID=A0A8X6P6H9_NEPPI|nr:hypothetical protein NPIL_389071 [Nephila pilipes]
MYKVIQRRGNYGRPEDYFFKDWNDYKIGFEEKDFKPDRISFDFQYDNICLREPTKAVQAPSVLISKAVDSETLCPLTTHSGLTTKTTTTRY